MEPRPSGSRLPDGRGSTVRRPLTPLRYSPNLISHPGRVSKQRDLIDADLAAWIEAQPVFFVATAPLSAEGHLNVSPKGGGALRALGPLEVAYPDYTGSGAETAAHLRENGRIVLMFCAFEGPPQIVRLHGAGEIVTPDRPEFADLAAKFPPNPGTRAIVRVAVGRVSDSCGYAAPLFEFLGQRDTLDRWAEKQGDARLDAYRARKNRTSIDGLPAFE